MKMLKGFLSIAILTLFSVGIALGSNTGKEANTPPATIDASTMPAPAELVIFDHISDYAELPTMVRSETTPVLQQSLAQKPSENQESTSDGGSNSILSGGTVTEFYDFRNYWSGYYYNEGDVSFSPYMYSNWSYAYNWQPTTFSLPEPATSITANVYDYLYYYNYYVAVLIAYDESGSYLGQVSSNHYGWADMTYTAPAGTKIGYFVMQHKYYSNYSWYVQYMWITYENNQEPIADAGADQSFDCVIGSQSVSLDGSGSSDPDGDVLTYSWTGSFGTASGVNPSIALGAGSHSISLTVDDGNGAVSSDDVLVTVVLDTEAPELEAPAAITVIANIAGGFSGAIGDAVALDVCDADPSISNDAPALFPLGDTEVTYTAVDEAGNSSSATQTVTVEPFPVTVDIKPGNDNNNVNPRSKGVIPVAILSDAGFDATTLDVSSLSFGPDGATTAHSGHIEDVDDDGDDDLMLHFRTRDTGISNSTLGLCMTGFTESGIPVAGCDGVNGNSLARRLAESNEGSIPATFTLEQNYPNPFNPSTIIEYGIPEASSVSLVVYNMLGARVASLVNDYQSAGSYQVQFDASELSSGTYIYVLNANGVQSIKRFSLMK